MSKPTDKPKRRLPLPRWSMKTMFVMITIICLVLGLVVRPAEQQRRAVAATGHAAPIHTFNITGPELRIIEKTAQTVKTDPSAYPNYPHRRAM